MVKKIKNLISIMKRRVKLLVNLSAKRDSLCMKRSTNFLKVIVRKKDVARL